MKNKKTNTAKLMVLLSLVLMIIIFAYILLNSDIFNSSNVKIEGNNRVLNKEIEKMLEIKEDKNIFMYNINQMEKILMENRYIESVEVERSIPNKLHILIKEKEIAAILENENNYCYIDKNGDLIQSFDKSYDIDKGVIVKVKYNLMEDKRVEFENEETKKRLLYLLECMKKENLYKKVKVVEFEKKSTINIYTSENIKFILPNNDKVDYNISMMRAILSDLQGKNITDGMVDFTLGNNPIYKK
ncbi:MAG: cell division protein FtsQ/DivIB [Romboutsia sp.]|uniref:cell division protein FtsQ/DivIB n=1 Tax=Romboutsia sp. TaxID=1965302 RepID=UPI003F2F53A8